MEPRFQQIPFNRDILLIIYTEHGHRKPAFALRNGFQAESFEPPQVQKPAQLSSINLSLDTDTWQAFRSTCAELVITPESQETAKEFLRSEISKISP